MTQDKSDVKNEIKQRLTAFVDPDLVKRAKVRGALEGLTISEIVEQALDAYTPKIDILISPKPTKRLVVDR